MHQGTPEGLAVKVCTRCGEAKPFSDFHRLRTGLRPTCKVCTNAQNRSIYRRNRDAHLEAKRRYRREQPEARQATLRKYDAANVEARRAHRAVQCAIQAGTLAPVRAVPCAHCGRQAEVYHHEAYDLPHWLDVVPLCRACHGEVHRVHA